MAFPTPPKPSDYIYGTETETPSGSTMYTPWQAPTTSGSTGGGTSSGAAGGGGSSLPTIDYGALIANDPILGQLKADLSAQGISDAGSRAAAIQRALVDWGVIPSDLNSLGLSGDQLKYLNSDVNQTTRDLATKNTKEGLSLFARLQKANQDNLRSIKNALAARGMAQSGEMGYQLGEEAQRFKLSTTDAQKQVLDYISGAVSAFAQSERDRQRELAQGQMDAADRAFGMYGGAGGAGGGGIGNSSDWIYGATLPPGISGESIFAAAQANAPSYGGRRFVPLHIMNQGQVQNGMISIKYVDPQGILPSDTQWIPLPAASTAPAPAPAPGPAPAPAPAPQPQTQAAAPPPPPQPVFAGNQYVTRTGSRAQ